MATPGDAVLAAAPPRRSWAAVLPAFVAPLPAFPAQLPNAPNRFPRGAVLGAAALGSRGLPSQLRADTRQPGAHDDWRDDRAFSLAGTALKQKTSLAADSRGGGEASATAAAVRLAAPTDESAETATAADEDADAQPLPEPTGEKRPDSGGSAAGGKRSGSRAPPTNGRLPGKVRHARAPPQPPPPPLRRREPRLAGLDDEYVAHLAALRRRMAALHRRSEPDGHATASPRRRRAAPKKLGDQLGPQAVTYLLAERKPIRLQEHFNFYP